MAKSVHSLRHFSAECDQELKMLGVDLESWSYPEGSNINVSCFLKVK